MRTGLLLLVLLCLPGAPPSRQAPFRPPQVFDLGAGHSPSALAVADFNGDGRLDVAVGSEGSDDVTIFLGDGRGGLRRSGSFRVVLADLDGDGRADAVTANSESHTISVLRTR